MKKSDSRSITESSRNIKNIVSLLFVVLMFNFQKVDAQIIQGVVYDRSNTEVLIGSTVTIFENKKEIQGVVTDGNGRFMVSLNNGDYVCSVQFLGYETEIREIQIKQNDTINVSFYLNEKYLEGVEAIISVRSIKEAQTTLITKDFFSRIPGAFDDPSRLLIKFPGLSASNDQSNELIVKGLAPHLSNWSIYGSAIINPNHLSNAGTITDQASSSGGGVNMISGNSILDYRFYSSPLNEERFDATGGISDTRLTIPKGIHYSLGILGTEISMGKVKENLEVGFNYRYSTLGILSAMGVDLGDEIINFQDFHGRIATKIKRHSLEWNILMGNSSNVHESLGSEGENFKDALRIEFRSGQVINSFKHQYIKGKIINDNVFNFSGRAISRSVLSDESIIPEYPIHEKITTEDLVFSINNRIRILQSDRLQYFVNHQYEYAGYSKRIQIEDFTKQYLSFGTRYSDTRYSIKAALGFSRFDNQFSPELRGAFKYRFSNSNIQLKYSRQAHSIIPEISIAVQEMNHFGSHNMAIDYSHSLESIFFQIGLFYHSYDGILNSQVSNVSYFDRVDLILQAIDEGSVTQDGTANLYGGQIQIEYFKESKFQIIQAASWYDLRVFTASKEIESSFNFNYTYATTASYSIDLGKNQLILGASVQGRGAGYDFEIDKEKSQARLATVFIIGESKKRTLSPYFRIDAKLDYVFGKKAQHRLSLDIQNVTNRKNDAYFHYDPLLQESLLQSQLGLIPVLKFSSKLR